MADFTFTELSPVRFLARSAEVHADRVAVVDGDLRLTYRELYQRCLALTGVLAGSGVESGDRVGVLATNSHVQLEMHHAVPMRGAVLVPLNARLSSSEVRYILEHSGASLLVVTEEFASLGRSLGIPVLVAGPDGDYESRVAEASPAVVPVDDERALLGINYT